MDGQESVFDNETFHKRLGALAFSDHSLDSTHGLVD